MNESSRTSATDSEMPPDAKGPVKTVLRIVLKLLRTFLIAYLLVVVMMMWLENRLIFPIGQISAGDWNTDGLKCEEVFFEAGDGTRLHGWYFDHPRPRAFVLYCHGNAEDVAHLGDYVDGLRSEYDIAVFAFDYRGYGKSEGKPTESGIVADAMAGQAWLGDRAGGTANLVLWGRSIGGAVAVQLAAANGARGIILERTFTTLPDVAAHHYPWLPVRWVMRNRFNSLSAIEGYQGPLLQSHGTADEVIPFEIGKRLFAAAPAESKRFIPLQDVTHNGPNTDEYYNELHRFFAELP